MGGAGAKYLSEFACLGPNLLCTLTGVAPLSERLSPGGKQIRRTSNTAALRAATFELISYRKAML